MEDALPDRPAPTDRCCAIKSQAPTNSDALDREIAGAVEAAHEFAEASPWPDPATATTHVYSSRESRATSAVPPPQPVPPREITYMQAPSKRSSEEMAKNPAIFVLGEGIGKRGGNFNTTAGFTTSTAPSGCATRRSASAVSSAWPAARP